MTRNSALLGARQGDCPLGDASPRRGDVSGLPKPTNGDNLNLGQGRYLADAGYPLWDRQTPNLPRKPSRTTITKSSACSFNHAPQGAKEANARKSEKTSLREGAGHD
jgi:hypothetical protein